MQENLQPGTFLQGKKYRIVRFIASGGFGCTYEGVHILLNRRVAIKEFFVKDFCNRDETNGHVTLGTVSRKPLVEKLREKFIKEAQGLCEFNHPGIVNVFDIFEENGTAYFVMDYIDGASLNEIVDKHGALPEAEALGYIRQIADALRQVHSKHRLHLDIKAGNIMVDREKHAVLIDFGASKQYDSHEGQNTSTLLGYTCGYAPPEQMSNAVQNFHASTDLYSLGATLYKLVTGETPPDAMTILSEGGLTIPGTVSPKVANAIKCAMQPVRSNRPQNVDDFLTLLDKEPESESTQPFSSKEEDTVVFAANTEPAPKPVPQPAPTSKPKTSAKPTSNARSSSVVDNKKRSKMPLLIAILGGIAIVFILFLIVGKDKPSSDVPNAITEVVEELDSVGGEYTNHAAEKFIYYGPLKDGMPHGRGEGEYSNGKYEGEYVNGERQGNGVFTLNSGTKMSGRFENDIMRDGKVQFTDGSVYTGTVNADGTFCDGKLVDKEGTYLYKGGEVVQSPQ